jgi:hypothetical protein
VSDQFANESKRQDAIGWWKTCGREEACCDWCGSALRRDSGFVVSGPTYILGSGPLARKVSMGKYLLCDTCFLNTNSGTVWKR